MCPGVHAPSPDRRCPAPAGHRGTELCDRDERLVNGQSVGQVIERVPDGDDGVSRRQLITWKSELTQFLHQVADRLAGDIEHRRGCVGGDDTMPGPEEFLREQACPAAEFEHKPSPVAYRGKQIQDSGGAGSCVEPETAMMH